MEKNYKYKSSIADGPNVVNIQNITIDNFKETITVSRQIGCKVDVAELTMEYAQQIGLIDLSVLKEFYGNN